MKITKRILREMIEAEINLLNEEVTEESLRDVFELFGSLVGVGPDGNVVSDIDAQPEAMANARNAFRSFHTTVTPEAWEGPRKGMLSRIYQVAQEKGLIDNTDDVPDDVVASWSGSPTTGQDFLADLDDDIDVDWGSEQSAGETAVAQEGEQQISTEDVATLDALLGGGRSVLRRGSRGEAVSALQRALKIHFENAGMDSAVEKLGSPDGAFGPNTKWAVEKWQYLVGMRGSSVDGVVGRQTWTSLKSGGEDNASEPTRARSASSGDDAVAQTDLGTTDIQDTRNQNPPPMREGPGVIGYRSIEGNNERLTDAFYINYGREAKGTWISINDDEIRARKYNDEWYMSPDGGETWSKQDTLSFLDNDDNKLYDFLPDPTAINAGRQSSYYIKNTQTIRASGLERNPESAFSRFTTEYEPKMIAIVVDESQTRLVHFDKDYNETTENRPAWYENELTFAKQTSSAGGEVNAQVSDDAPTADSLNPLPGRSADAGPNESFTYDRFSKLAGLLKG